MNLTNDSYVILISTKTSTERYYRDKAGWLKVSTRGRTFRATAEQVLNHVLPVLAGTKPRTTIKVEHHEPDDPHQETGRIRDRGRSPVTSPASVLPKQRGQTS
jgi:hypothetical protein